MRRIITRRNISVLLAALLVASMTGCTEWTVSSSSAPETPSSSEQQTSSGRLPDDKPAWDEVSSHDPGAVKVSVALPQVETPFGRALMRVEYERLPNQETKQAYVAMLQAASKITDDRSEQGEYRIERVLLEGVKLSERELRLVLSALRTDNPQIFWITNRFGYYINAEGTSVELYSYYSAAECVRRSEELAQAVEKLCRVLNDGQSLFNRELLLHNALLYSVVYDQDAADSTTDPEPFTAYGALVEGKAVCQGYALAMKLLLCYAGIESTVISGSSEGVAHAWNAVKLYGEWYYLDATWNDMEENIRYDYFNITTELLQLDHAIDPVYSDSSAGEQYNLWTPDCTASEQNYFIKCAVHLDGFDEENDKKLLAELRTMLASGDQTLVIRFDPALDYEEAIAMLITEQPYKLIYLMQTANHSGSSVNRFAMENIQYVKTPNQNAVTIWLQMEQSMMQ